MIEPDLEDLLQVDRYWCCEKCEAPFATKELAEKHELKCYVLEDIKEDVENLEKMLEKTDLGSNELRKALEPFQNIAITSPINLSSKEIKSMVSKGEALLIMLEEKDKRENARLGKLKKVKQREDALDFDAAIEIWEELGEITEAARVRKMQAEMGSVKVAQNVVHGDTIVKDSVVNKSNISGKSKAEEIKEIKELLDSGAIDDAEFKQMKKEILGK